MQGALRLAGLLRSAPTPRSKHLREPAKAQAVENITPWQKGSLFGIYGSTETFEVPWFATNTATAFHVESIRRVQKHQIFINTGLLVVKLLRCHFTLYVS